VVVVSQCVKKKADETTDKAAVILTDLKQKALETKDGAVTILRDPQFQKYTIATTGGAVVFGTAGGAFGTASGVVMGSAAGVVPALFTFGLSIPAGGAIGGIGGLCAGTLVGGTSGGIGGYTIYKYRVEIKNGVIVVKVEAENAIKKAKLKATGLLSDVDMQARKLRTSVIDIAGRGKHNSRKALEFAKMKASETLNLATTTRVGVTSTSAVAGAVVAGTTTGAFGAVAGAAVGIVPAFFTLGLSIPVGAVIGSCVGTTVGGTAGAVGGGALGYGGFTYRETISDNIQSSWSKVSTKADTLRMVAFSHVADAKESMKSIVRGSTGGSDHDKAD